MNACKSLPRPEYPRPQFVRHDWLCLNGEWEFEIDQGDSGLHRGLLERPLKERIVVPFCPESRLSGIGNTDYLNAVWYRRVVTIPKAWEGRRILLHFQASDYDTFVWANGAEVGRHRGGMTPFVCDLTEAARSGEAVTLVVRARDNARDSMPSGKQAWTHGNGGCHYTRTTGIWQTVWMEPVPLAASLLRPKIIPDTANGRFLIEQPVFGAQTGLRLRARLRDGAEVAAEAVTACGVDFTPRVELTVPPQRVRLWSPEDPHLYDITLELLDASGAVVDEAATYAGLRSLSIEGMAVKLNGKRVFQRLVLDQGYYPDGILTAPTDAALEADIRLAQSAGFNGARLHQKVFEERFLYHADRLGYLVWGEFSDWGLGGREAFQGWEKTDAGMVQRSGNHSGTDFPPGYTAQWLEALQRDFNHPSIVGWCPLNESNQRMAERITSHDDTMRAMFLAAKLYDPTRPVLDVSGYSHRIAEADIYDSHDYTQDPDAFAKRYSAGGIYRNDSAEISSIPHRGQPYFVSEFGGIRWNPATTKNAHSWGYGDDPKTLEEFYRRFEGLCRVLLEAPHHFGYCYTQLTDVFQEQNGLYTFDREPKFDLARIRSAQRRPAAIEAV
ncbi:MAG: glycoside hydrolase family 2 TIM barrel-domain containing protein [Chthoniobacteraceae bacterium]|nr:glycoside hydrolase family 2 TIM barrel-domain containing protein [Chthoniobacteraceae bacterium]